ncbi:hypothetical protein Tco_1291356 [Tanacetum coccineum]
MTDAKDMWIAIKSRFGGNDESKKMQKYILKQQFEGFTVSNSDGIHKEDYERSPKVKTQSARDSSSRDIIMNSDGFKSDQEGIYNAKNSTTKWSLLKKEQNNARLLLKATDKRKDNYEEVIAPMARHLKHKELFSICLPIWVYSISNGCEEMPFSMARFDEEVYVSQPPRVDWVGGLIDSDRWVKGCERWINPKVNLGGVKGKITPLFDNMLVQPTQKEGTSSERLSEAHPTPSPEPTSEAPNESMNDSSSAQSSEVPFEQQPDLSPSPSPRPSPNPSPTPNIPDSIPEHTGENLGDHSFNDTSLSGNEDAMTLQNVYDLSYQKRISKEQRHQRKHLSKKKKVQIKSVSKQGRKNAKGDGKAKRKCSKVKEGQKKMIDEDKETDNTDESKWKVMMIKLMLLKRSLKVRRPEVKVLKSKLKVPGAHAGGGGKRQYTDDTLVDRDEETRRERLLGHPLITINMKEAANEASKNFDDVKARIEADRILAEKLQEQEREQFTIEERAKFLHDTIAAQRKFLAQQRSQAKRNKPPTKNQLRNQMITYLKHVGNFKHSNLKSRKFEDIQALYKNIKRFNEHFISTGSAKDERFIKQLNKKRGGLSKSEVIKEDTKEEVKDEDKDEESTRKRKLGTRKKMKSRKRRYIQHTSEDDSDKENDDLRLYLTIAQDEDKEVDYEILDRKYPIIDWKTECFGTKPQPDEAKSIEEINLNVVTRSNGQQRHFSVLTSVLSIFDREDLNAVYQLVMNKYQDEMPEGFERVLWGDLMVLFNPDEQDEFWSSQHEWKIISWKLHNSSGVHTLMTNEGVVIHMLTEKKYPLKKEILVQMH